MAVLYYENGLTLFIKTIKKSIKTNLANYKNIIVDQNTHKIYEVLWNVGRKH